MDETVVAQPSPDPAACKAELETVLASQTFGRAPAVSKILRFVCTRYLEGSGDTVTEWSIAIDGLGRRDTFDPERDAIVRVEFHLLRKRLTQYYLKEGAHHAVRITFGENGYLPRFVLAAPPAKVEAGRMETAAVLAASPPSRPASETIAAQVAGPPQSQPETPAVKHADSPALSRPAGGQTILWMTAATVLLALLLMMWSQGPRPSAAGNGMRAPSPTAEGGAIRIATGISAPKYIDSSGNSWSGDAYATGGTVFDLPDRKIFRTLDQDLYERGREGEFRYDIPARPGTYELRLHFAETRYGQSPMEGAEGARKFDVALDGKLLLVDFDIALDAAGANTATVKAWKDVGPAADGLLHLAFTGRTGSPLLNAIELLPANVGEPLAVRISCGPRALSDKQGRLWQADAYFQGGRLMARESEVAGAEDDSIFASSRVGNFSYAIPVVAGFTYKAMLHFTDATHAGVGERLFDVHVNGMQVMHDYDVIAKSGGPRRAASAALRNLHPNAQGKLLFTFTPVRDSATVSAIEVEAER